MNIVVIGDDRRMEYVATYFYNLGYDTSRNICDINENSIVVLQPVINKQIENSLKNIIRSKRIFAGKISSEFGDFCNHNSIKIENYLLYNDFVCDNAVLTAKGLVKEAKNDGVVFEASSCLVAGYGNCGKAIVSELINNNAKVDVLVRLTGNKINLENDAVGIVNIDNINEYNFEKYSYVFNTIPSLVIDRTLIDNMSRNVMIYDIASFPGGVNFEYCKSKSIFVSHNLGIPGKEYPKKAGEIIAKSIYNRIS